MYIKGKNLIIVSLKTKEQRTMKKIATVNEYSFDTLTEMTEFLKSDPTYRRIQYYTENGLIKNFVVLVYTDSLTKKSKYLFAICGTLPNCNDCVELTKYLKEDGTYDDEQFAKDYDMGGFIGREEVEDN